MATGDVVKISYQKNIKNTIKLNLSVKIVSRLKYDTISRIYT